MQKLNIPLMCTLLLLSLVVCPVLYIYPEYADYCKKVSTFFPGRKYIK